MGEADGGDDKGAEPCRGRSTSCPGTEEKRK